MVLFFLILAASLLGILGNWITRWSLGRTQYSFIDYLLIEKARTLSSVFSIISSAFIIYSSVPDTLVGKSLIMVLGGAYAAGFTLDSKINKEGPIIEEQVTPSKKIIIEKDKSIDSLLEEDKSL